MRWASRTDQPRRALPAQRYPDGSPSAANQGAPGTGCLRRPPPRLATPAGGRRSPGPCQVSPTPTRTATHPGMVPPRRPRACARSPSWISNAFTAFPRHRPAGRPTCLVTSNRTLTGSSPRPAKGSGGPGSTPAESSMLSASIWCRSGTHRADHRVVGPVLPFERRHQDALTGQQTTETRSHQALAGIPGGARHEHPPAATQPHLAHPGRGPSHGPSRISHARFLRRIEPHGAGGVPGRSR